MTDPITSSIATVLVAGATAAVTDGGRAVIATLVNAVRERFRRNPSDQDTLDAATRSPNDPAVLRRLAELLDVRMRDDPGFAERLRSLWDGVAAAEATHHDEVTNTVSGPVRGSVVQARDIHGGITFNDPR